MVNISFLMTLPMFLANLVKEPLLKLKLRYLLMLLARYW